MGKVYGRQKVGRSVTITHCHGQRVSAKDPPEFEDFSFDVWGTYTEERATNYARRLFGDKTITINYVEHETRFYTASIQNFITVAERTK